MVAWTSGDYLRGLLLVSALLIIFMLFSLTPAPLGAVMPFWGIIPLFFFSLTRPHHLPAWLLFFTGLAMDVLQGMPPGMHPILFITFHILVRQLARHFQRKSVWNFWAGFVFCSLGYWGGSWLLFLLLSGHRLDMALIIVPWLATSVFYPMLHLLLSRLLPFIPPAR